MMKIIILVVLINCLYVLSVCPNSCSGHGKCVASTCVCFSDSESGDSYSGNDCSYHNCGKGNPFAAVNSNPSDSSDVTRLRTLQSKKVEEAKEVNKARMLQEIGSGVEISLVDTESVDGANSLWKVKGLSSFTSIMPKSGGNISCDFYAGEEEVPTDDNKNIAIDIRGFTNDHAYVLFRTAVSNIGESGVPVPTSDPRRRRLEAAKYSKVVCKDILSMRENLVHYHPEGEFTISTTRERQLFNNSRQLPEPTEVTMTWNNYGDILKDMGLLKETIVTSAPDPEPEEPAERRRVAEAGKTVYKNDKFSFGCFEKKSDSAPIISTETVIEIINNVVAEYDPTIEGNKDVVFTYTGSQLTGSAPYSCYCLMDGEGTVIDITETDLNDNIRQDDPAVENIYQFGKYPATDNQNTIEEPESGENGHTVIIASSLTSATEIPGAETYAKNGYLVEKRVVYLAIFDTSDFTIKEKEVEIKDDYMLPKIDGDLIIFPYIRTYPIDPTTELPTPVISGKLNTGQDSPFLYRTFYFSESLISGLNETGGIIKCLKGNEKILIDVKGVAKDGKYPIFSLIESDTDITNEITQLNCYGIDKKRNDFSLSNPSKVTIPSGNGRMLQGNSITWYGYNGIFPITSDYQSGTLKFMCYLPSNLAQAMVEVGINKIENPSNTNNIQFELIVTDPPPNGDYTCYLLADVNGGSVAIDKSDLYPLVREKAEGEYYFGKVEVSNEVKIEKIGDVEVIPLDGTTNTIKDNKITLKKITADEKDEVMKKLKVDNIFYLKLHKINAVYIEKIQQITITKVTVETTPGRRLLAEETTVITYNPEIESGYESDNMLYDSPPPKGKKDCH